MLRRRSWVLGGLVTGLVACGTSSVPARDGGGEGGGAGASRTGGSVGATGGTGGGAWRAFAANSIWNTPIAANPPLDPESTSLVNDLATLTGQGQQTLTVNIQSFGVPVYWVDSTKVPMVTVKCDLGGTGFRTGAPREGDVPGSGPAPIPSDAMATGGSDRHICIVDPVAEKEWDLYGANYTNGNWTASLAAAMDLTTDGVRPPTQASPWWAGQGCRACGYPLVAGLILADELRAGAIEHALVLAYPHARSRYYTPPASSAQGTFTEARPDRGVMCGGRFQLDPALDLSTLGLSRTGLIIGRALQKYGAFMGDYSGAISLYADGAPSAQAYWNSGVLGNDDVNKLPLTRFRILKNTGTIYDNNN